MTRLRGFLPFCKLVAASAVFASVLVACSPPAWGEEEIRRAIEKDWALQDGLYGEGGFQTQTVVKPIEELGSSADDLLARYRQLVQASVAANDPRWIELYHEACHRRRAKRVGPFLDKLRRIVFTKHFDMGGSHYAYTEAQSDAQHERNFKPGASLCILEMDGLYGRVKMLLHDPDGVIRDPDVSFDGKRILFAWKKSDRHDDYHLYEMEVDSGDVRQLTFGLGFADYEGAYLPGGDLVFNSTRPVQIVDCWWTEVSNLYTCDGDGQYMRRLSFDQVHTNFPTVTPDGRVIYTRWDYSDRGQIYPQGLFVMNPDGTGQTEFYGNNSWFPTAILHARGIPGTSKVLAVLSGHHTHQRGKLAIIDPSRGRQEADGVQLIAPLRPTSAERVDAWGQEGEQFQYPYPLDESAFLVAMDPAGSPNRSYRQPYGIYFIAVDGERELLAADPKISCNQPIPLHPRPLPHPRPNIVNYRDRTGTYYLHDIYRGPGLAGVPRGTIKRLRVVAIEFRAAGIRCNYSEGPAGAALASTPVSIGNGCWDVKVVLGETPVFEDGSACFQVPARTPVYFQALDGEGRAVQTMRSWSTLQPGESLSCVGCHESKNAAPAPVVPTRAMQSGPRQLDPFYGPPRAFSFSTEIEPILDRHCVRCHDDRSQQVPWDNPTSVASTETQRAFSLLSTANEDTHAGRMWSDAYVALTRAGHHSNRWKSIQGKPNRLVTWITTQSEPSMLPAYHAGSPVSGLLSILHDGHAGLVLSREEMEKIACWIDLGVPYCGDYREAAAWSPEETEKYEHFLEKRRQMQRVEQKNIEAFLTRH